MPTGACAPDVVGGEPPIPPVDPALVRASAFRIVELPAISVGANPDIGLVAMPAWFWVQGYSGGTLSGSSSLDRSIVDVEITPTGCRWSFGDGAALYTGSVGGPIRPRATSGTARGAPRPLSRALDQQVEVRCVDVVGY